MIVDHAAVPMSRFTALLGATLLVNFALVAGVCIALGAQEQIWWMSNVALLMGGAGLLLRSPLLTCMALAGVLVPHFIWVVDCTIGFTLGVHPAGVTQYLHDAGPLMWLKTLHHFYLAPILLAVVRSRRVYPAELIPCMLLLFAVLTTASRLLPAESNVNSAYAFLPLVKSASIEWTNALPPFNYIVVMNAGAFLLFVMPADMIIRRLTGAPPAGLRAVVPPPDACANPA